MTRERYIIILRLSTYYDEPFHTEHKRYIIFFFIELKGSSGVAHHHCVVGSLVWGGRMTIRASAFDKVVGVGEEMVVGTWDFAV